MDMDMDMDIDKLTINLNKISIFSDQDEYMKLHDVSMIEIYDLEGSEVLELLDNTYKRYKRYLNIIEFTNDSIYIKKYIAKFIKKYHDSNFNERELINIMRKTDSFILDTIHSSNESVFWLNNK